MKIAILLATHNGQEFIEDQLYSFLAQSYDNFDLIISDDCSDDGTFELLESIADKHENIILLNKERQRFGSAQKNFIYLSTCAYELNYDYYFFSDQDDIWDENKVMVQMAQLSVMEKKFGTGIPLLVHSDLTIVDSNLDVLSWSYFRSQRIFLRSQYWQFVVCSNVVTGCTMAVNKSQIEIFLKFADQRLLHDHQMAILVCRFGKIYTSALSLVKYRQHQSNVVGAHSRWTASSRFIHNIRNLRRAYYSYVSLREYVSSFEKSNFFIFYFLFCKIYLFFAKFFGRFTRHV